MAEPGARRLMTDRPGATRSGLASPSAAVGPWPEKPAMTSSPRPAVPRSSDGADGDDERVVTGLGDRAGAPARCWTTRR